MKEAAGEANMTVITIVLIAIVLGVGTLIVTQLMNKTKNDVTGSTATTAEACKNAGGTWNENAKICSESK